MTIHLPEDLERYVHEQVQAGRFPSEDDVIHDALQRHRQAQVTPPAVSVSIGPIHEGAGLVDEVVEQAMATAKPVRKPIWERAAELRKTIPAEEWDKLPADGARQLKHYLYGSPKRPAE
jgi:putative addiction module CopG family antidote